MRKVLMSGKRCKTFSAVIGGCVTVTVVLISSSRNYKSASSCQLLVIRSECVVGFCRTKGLCEGVGSRQ